MIGNAVQGVRVGLDQEVEFLHQQSRKDHATNDGGVVVAAQLHDEDLIANECERVKAHAHLLGRKEIVDQRIFQVGDRERTEV